MNLNKSFFRLAKNVAKLSDHRVKVGCVISKKRPLIAASNISKTHPIFANPYNSIVGSIHAEIRCITHLNRKDLKGATIYIYRETKDGIPAYSRPCEMCMKEIIKSKIKYIYYTVDRYPYYIREKVQ